MSKFRLAAIGTCRIHNPVRSAVGKYPIDYQTARNYGYTHTSREALQQLAFLKGELEFPRHLVPGIFRTGTSPADVADEWPGAHLVIVEISSLKVITAGEFYLQTRYLSQHFADFFANPARSRPFWSLAEQNPEALADFLNQDAVFGAMTEDDQRLLSSVRMKQQTFDELRQDMALLYEQIGADKILFLTHVGARDANGRPIAAREKLIRWVEHAAQELEAPCFNPTSLMLEHGQERSMENGGADTTHYTDEFYNTIYAHLHRHYIAPHVQRVIGASSENDSAMQNQMLADAIGATLRHVDLVSGARQLHSALRNSPDSPPLIELRGTLREMLGDFEGAVDDLSSRLPADYSAGATAREALMRALVEIGEPRRALEISDLLLKQEHESIDLHRISAAAADQVDMHERALEHRKSLWRLDRADVATAIRVLESIAGEGEDADREWREELAYFARSNPKLAEALLRHALTTRDADLFGTSAEALATQDALAAGELLLYAQGTDLLLPASKAIGLVLASHNLPSRLLRSLRDLGRQWGADAIVAGEQCDFDTAAKLAVASFEALGEQHGGLRGLRTVAAAMLTRARQLAAEGESQKIIDLCEGRDLLVMARPRLALELFRALDAVGRRDEAVALATRAANLFPSDVTVAIAAARLLTEHDVGLAAKFYENAAAGDEEGRYSDEIARFRESASGLALAQIGENIAAGRFAEAIRILPLLRSGHHKQRAEEERERLYRAMRTELDRSRTERNAQRRQTILSQLIEFAPEDPSLLKEAATEATNDGRFGDALRLWEQLARTSPGDEDARKALTRCRMLLGEGKQAKPGSVGAL